MKLSKQRKKARSRFQWWSHVLFRWDADGLIHDTKPGPLLKPGGYTEVVIVRGRVWTRPQCARRVES